DAHPEVFAGFRTRMHANDTAGYAPAAHTLANLDLLPRSAGSGAPTPIIVRADDPATPVPPSQNIRGTLLPAEMVILPDAAHIVAVEAADRVNEYLGAFLARGERRTAPGAGASLEDGFANRTMRLGADYVETALAKAGTFGAPWQALMTRTAWG